MKKKIILIIFLLVAIGGACTYLLLNRESFSTVYLASDDPVISLLDENGEEVSFYRGTEVSLSSRTKKIGDEKYSIIIHQEERYFLKEEDYCQDRYDCVKEKQMVTLRTVTALKDYDSYPIAGRFEKNMTLDVTGHSEVGETGEVDFYLLSDGKQEGYVSSAFLAKSFSETAYDASVYEEYWDFGGGEPSELTYYPKEKVSFEDNTMPQSVQALYINAGAICNADRYIELGKQSGINAFVIDIKDCYIDTQLAYHSPVGKQYAPCTENIVNTMEAYEEGVKKLKDAGFYLIGRITAFKDDAFAKDNPSEAVFTEGTPYIYGRVCWPSIYSRKMWEYDLALAYEAADMGFNEIQFDYVRFPEFIPDGAELRNEYDEVPAEAIGNFLSYAAERLHYKHVYISADVFGETSGSSVLEPSSFVTSYGQFWPLISNRVDVISSMPYPDHFASGAYGIPDPWAQPGRLMDNWAKATIQAQSITYDPAIVRTWIQAQSSDSYGIYYGPEEIKGQIKGLYNNGLTGGYMTWNSPSNIAVYQSYLSAFE